MKNKKVGVILKRIIATLEAKRRHPAGIYASLISRAKEVTLGDAATVGREMGLVRAIEVVKDELKELEK